MTAAFPPHPTDDPARMAAVLAYIARKIAEEMRRTRRRKPEAMTTARLLAALPEAPLPPAIEMLFSDAAMRDIPILTPDFSPDFLSHVEQWPLVVRRAEAAEILDVSLDWFDRNVDRLMREACFPAPRSATGQKRWLRAAIAAWADANSHHPALARARAAHAKAKKTCSAQGGR